MVGKEKRRKENAELKERLKGKYVHVSTSFSRHKDEKGRKITVKHSSTYRRGKKPVVSEKIVQIEKDDE